MKRPRQADAVETQRIYKALELLAAGEKQAYISAVTGLSQQRISDIKRQYRDELETS